jgi:hypothetical protein
MDRFAESQLTHHRSRDHWANYAPPRGLIANLRSPVTASNIISIVYPFGCIAADLFL